MTFKLILSVLRELRCKKSAVMFTCSKFVKQYQINCCFTYFEQ